MAQVTGRKVATTPIVPTPSGGGNVINSWNTSDNKETNAPSMKIVKDGLDEINDNLSGFKFYPTGTGIVGLISDDSAYTDANGKYVIWGTPTAEQLVEDNPNTYKAVASTEDTRGKVGADTASPFNKQIDWQSISISGMSDTQYISATIGHKYIIAVAFTTGNYNPDINISSGATVLTQSSTVHMRINENVIKGHIRMFVVEATSSTIQITSTQGNLSYGGVIWIDVGK